MSPRDWSSVLLPRPATWRRTLLAIVVAVAGSALAVVFVQTSGFPFRSLPFVLVIMTATVIGKRVAGAVAVVVAALFLDYFVIAPVRSIDFAGSTDFWAIVGFAAVMLVAAQLVGWLESVGGRERVERERASLLVRTADAVSSAVGADRALQEMARALVPGFADWAVVHVVRDDGSIRRVATVHAAGGQIEAELRAAPEAVASDERGPGAVIRTGRTERYVSASSDLARALGTDDGRVRAAAQGWLSSCVVAPLTARGRTFGALAVVRSSRRPAFSDRDVTLIEEIAERGALVVDNVRLVELERRSAGLNTVLQELTSALSASVTAADVGRTVVEQGVRALGAAAAAFAVRSDGTVELREAYGYEAAIGELRTFSLDDPLPLSEAMRTGRPVVVRSIDERNRRFPTLRGVEPTSDHALVCLPFIVRGRAIGGLAVTFSEPRGFTDWELAFMESIAAQAGQALDRAMLFESERAANARLETSADRLERLLMLAYRLSRTYDRAGAARAIVDGGIRAAGASLAALLVVDATSQELVLEASSGVGEEAAARFHRIPMFAPFAAAEVARSGHPVWVQALEEWRSAYPVGYRAAIEAGEDPAATALLPLVVAGRTLAVLALGYGPEREFDEEDRDFLLTLAGLCAQSLQGALVLEEREQAQAEAEQAREQIEFLAEATRLLSTSLDLEETMDELANLCVPRIADWISVSITEGPELRQLVVRHQDPDKIEFADDLRTMLPFERDAPAGIARVLREARSELYEEIDDELLKSSIADLDALEAVRALGLTSIAIVPLAVQDRVLGAVTVAYAESGRHYDRRDLTFLESIARRAAVAIDNARLFSDREEMARALQRSLLPRRLPTIHGAELAVRYIPFGQGHDVGGDFYDVFAGHEGSWGLLIGDVCGKGPEAASIVGIARHTVRGLAVAHSRPSAILEALNRAILDESPWDRFCTACYVRLRPHESGFRATLALGGHLPPFVVSADGSIRQVGEPGSLLGVLDQPELSDVIVDLVPGDILLLYTDGLEEPRSARDGIRGVEEILVDAAGASAEDVADALLAKFRGDAGEPPRDDVALVALRVVGETN